MLTDFGITNPNEAFHFLREFAHIYYMAPQMGNIGPIIEEDRNLIGLPKRPSLKKLLKDWHFAWVEFQETGDARSTKTGKIITRGKAYWHFASNNKEPNGNQKRN